MLEFDRNDVSGGNEVNKTDGSRECIICHYWYFLDINFSFQPEVCNGCHDLMQKGMNFNNVAIVTLKRNDYSIYFLHMNQDYPANLLRNADLTEKVEHFKI